MSGDKLAADDRGSDPAPPTRRSFLSGVGAVLGGALTARGERETAASAQEVTEGRFAGNYYDRYWNIAYVGPGSTPYAKGARADYNPYTDQDAQPTPLEGWQQWYAGQPMQWQIYAPTDWESMRTEFGSLQGIIPPGRNWPLWLNRSLEAGLVYDSPLPIPTGFDTGIAAWTQLIVEQVDYADPLGDIITANHQQLSQYDPIYSDPQYPSFGTAYTQTNGEPGFFWVRWQLPPERYWRVTDGTDMSILAPGTDDVETLVVQNWVMRGSTLYVVHADIKLHHDPTTMVQGVMRGWIHVTRDVLYQMATSFTTYTYQ